MATRREVGQIEKRGDRYRARIAVGTKADGSRRTASKTFATRDEAKAWLIAQAVEMGKRPDVGAGITLKTLWSSFETARESSLTKKTMGVYRWNVERIWMPALGDMDVTAITPAKVQRILDGLTYENAKHAKTALSSVLTWAARSDIIQSNPLRGHAFVFPEREVSDTDFDDDPFAEIEGTRDVWTAQDVLRCLDIIQGLPLEPAWLMCVGAGLRVEEALAIRRMDVRRVEVGGREVTQVAVHAAKTAMDGRKGTKTKQSVRIVGMVEPMGERLWELAQTVDDRRATICTISAHRQNKAWRNYFEPPTVSKHAKKKGNYRGRLQELPYIPLSKMRNTHVTMMAEAGVSDSLNALYHGHTESVERRHYLSPDMTAAAAKVSDHLKLVM
jgi:hypothetical protein